MLFFSFISLCFFLRWVEIYAQLWDKAEGWMHSGSERSSAAFIFLLQRLHSHSWRLCNARPASLFSPSVALPSLPCTNLSISVDVLQCTVSNLLTPSRPTVTQISIYWMQNVSNSQQLFPSLLESQNALNREPAIWVFTSDLFYSLKCSSASPLHQLVSKFQTFGPISSIIFQLLCCLAVLNSMVNDTAIMNIKLNCCTDSQRKYLLYKIVSVENLTL